MIIKMIAYMTDDNPVSYIVVTKIRIYPQFCVNYKSRCKNQS